MVYFTFSLDDLAFGDAIIYFIFLDALFLILQQSISRLASQHLFGRTAERV